MDIKIATQCLSAPKHEDVILTAFTAGLYAIVLADGASSYRWSGGETSGGGGEAAQIAAHTALTHLIGPQRPSLGIDEMMAHLQGCFAGAQTALEQHNAATRQTGPTDCLHQCGIK
jgi:hypothetical protein